MRHFNRTFESACKQVFKVLFKNGTVVAVSSTGVVTACGARGMSLFDGFPMGNNACTSES